jgi:predicted transposase YdaD
MYDNVCKFLAESFSQDFAQWLLAEPIGLTQLNRSKNLVVYLNYFFAIGCG